MFLATHIVASYITKLQNYQHMIISNSIDKLLGYKLIRIVLLIYNSEIFHYYCDARVF